MAYFPIVIVNAADNKQRDPDMDKLDVSIDAQNNVISVRNNGKGIPIVMHKEHKVWVPTLIFGHLLTGSNFDDTEAKTTGGRNGYGAKLANIFSTEFIVECLDSNEGKKFTQVFKNNMGLHGDPVVKDCTAADKKKGDYVKITFSPDLARFKMSALDKDFVGLLSKRAYDVAGSMASSPGKKLQVTLNGNKVPIKSFQDYVKIYKGVNVPVAYEKVDDRWEVGVSHSSSDGSPIQISFVNAICTYKGGSHVNFVADKIANYLAKIIEKKNKGGVKINNRQIKNHLCIFINCLVENPTFDSQTKDALTNRPKQFANECDISEKFLKQAAKSDIVENILAFAKFKQSRELKRNGGTKKIKLTGIQKLDDANRAGSVESHKCTLIITEGDSAKSLAMSGLSITGRDYYGVYPLKGKPLNVRDATHANVMKNEEIKNIIDILGLKHGVEYTEENIKTLRYGHLMIMADQDHDGSHIKGLVINFIHHFWPSLLDVPGFLQQFITPIVKASKGKQSLTFFTLPEYEEWKESTGNDAKGWKIKYYKGLGTSTAAEAKEYFSNLDRHEITFEQISLDFKDGDEAMDELDFDATAEGVVKPDKINSYGSGLIDMVFSKKRVEDRKDWLNALEKDTFLDYGVAQKEGVKYSQFVNRELILFSKADCERSIPHIMDGFKPSQRKVMFACFKRKLKDEIKVAQLAGYIGEHSAYHHGEASLYSTIINMAQSFVGANNINLLTPSGQFGTRRMGGKDSASPRYIFTKLEKITRTIFHPDDDELLNYLNDDGMSIEPEHFMPVIPMILVNGAEGIGTGWSSKVANYDPRLIIANIRRMIKGEVLEEMHPFFSGFVGEIIPDGDGKYLVKGVIERTNETTLVISELPVKKWTQDYKEFLEKKLVSEKAGQAPEIRDFQENHTDTTVSFKITADKDLIDEWEATPKGGLYAKFSLAGSLSTSNMHLYDTEQRIIKYEKPEDILKVFFDLRLEFYARRKDLLVKKLRREQRMLSNKARFVEEVCSGELVVSNRKKAELLADLQRRGYDLFDKADGNEETTEDETDEESSLATLSKGYEYLLGMKIWSLTYEKAQELRKQLAERTAELKDLEGTAPSQIWLNDLDAIEVAMDERDIEIAEAHEDEKKAQSKTAKRNASKQKKTAATAKKRGTKGKKGGWNSEDEESDEEMDYIEADEAKAVKKASAVRGKTASGPKKPIAPKKPTKASVVKASQLTEIKGTKETEAIELMEDEPEEVELSLRERLALKKNAVSISTSNNDECVGSKSSGSKRPSPKSSENGKAALSKRPKAVSTKSKTVPKSDKPSAKATGPKSKKKLQIEESSEEEFDVADSDSDMDVEVIPAPVARPNRRGAAKSYAEDDEDDFMVDEGDSDDDSAF